MFHNSTLCLKTIKVEMSGWHSHVFWKIWQYLSSVYCHTFPTWTLKDGLNCYSVLFQHKKQQWLNNAKFDIEKNFLAVFVILIVKARSQFYALNVESGYTVQVLSQTKHKNYMVVGLPVVWNFIVSFAASVETSLIFRILY